MNSPKRWQSVVCLLLGVWLAGSVAASGNKSQGMTLPATLSAMQQRLADTQRLTSTFTQTRTLTLLSRPLISSGTMAYDKKEGICWQLLKPVPASVMLSRDQVLVQDIESKQVIKQTNPVLRLYSNLLFSVFSGDLAALQEHFTLTWSTEGDRWQLNLQPLDPLMAQLAATIRIIGGQHIDQVSLLTQEGDQTLLEFDSVKSFTGAPAQLTFECGQ